MAADARTRRLMGESAITGALFAMLAISALVLAWPWRPVPPPGGTALDRYAPLRQGDARLVAQYDAEGQLTTWSSDNVVLLRGVRALTTDLRHATRTALVRFYEKPENARLTGSDLSQATALQIVVERERTLGGDGVALSRTATYVREPRGDLLFGTYDAASGVELVFDPPMLILPSDLNSGVTWEREGRAGGVTYRFRGSVGDSGPHETPLQRFDDCLRVETRLQVFAPDSGSSTPGTVPQVLEDTLRHTWYCAGAGAVDGRRVDPAGAFLDRRVLAGRRADEPRAAALAAALPPPRVPAISRSPEPAGMTLTALDPAWDLTRFGRADVDLYSSYTTFQPQWIPSDPPAVLVAGYDGELIAFAAEGPPGTVLWRFRPAGTIYGTPGFDPSTGRLYFGASDKHLYALDARGLFLWAVKTGDNVASRPLVTRGTVVFGSEDRLVYGLDAETGAPRWAPVETDAAVVSWPALVDGLVVIGSDDGTVYAIDPVDGTVPWRYTTEKAVEAPVVADGGNALVASRDGTLSSLNVAACRHSEPCRPVWTAQLGATLRSAPVVVEDRIYVMDTDGRITAVEHTGGRRLWTTVESGYAGPPLPVAGGVVLGGNDGTLHHIALDGKRTVTWTIRADVPGGAQGKHFRFGPAAGGGALWVGDSAGTLWRLGPTLPGPHILSAAWVTSTTLPPLRQQYGIHSPVAPYVGKALAVDAGRYLYSVDPATGQAISLGRAGGEGTLSNIDPVVDGDRLLTIAGGAITATDLVAGRSLWTVAGQGIQVRPPVVAGSPSSPAPSNTVLWVTAAPNAADAEGGTLSALDAVTGIVRWQQPLAPATIPGGVVSGRDAAYTSAPPAAFDLTTGDLLWRAETGSMSGLGGPALRAGGSTLFTGLIEKESDTGSIIALDAASGALRWRAALGDDPLSPTEALWLSGDTVIVPTLRGRIVALDAATGALRWTHNPATARWGSVTVSDERVWYARDDSRLVGLDVVTGNPVAHFAGVDAHLGIHPATGYRPAVIGGRVIMPMSAFLLGVAVTPAAPADGSEP